MSTRNRTWLVAALLAALVLTPLASARAEGEDPLPPRPGYVEGIGTHFEVTDSEYLNVTLDSTESIALTLLSVPYVVDMTIESAGGGPVTQITLRGLAADTTYYRYQDAAESPVVFTTDASGSHIFELDLSAPHVVWLQLAPSTITISDAPNGGQCILVGTWNAGTKSCTLTGNVANNIVIGSSGITLDGNGWQVLPQGTNNANGVYVFNRGNVTLKNLSITGFVKGVYVYSQPGQAGGNNTVRGNTITGGAGSDGMEVLGNSNATITGNVVSAGANGIVVRQSQNSVVSHNTVSGGQFGIALPNGHYSTVADNTVLSSNIGLYSGGGTVQANNCTAYNNNFVGVVTPILFRGTGNSFNLPAPGGGNYYSNFDQPGEGCSDVNSDGFCDAPFAFTNNQDNLPWIMQDGWHYPTAEAGGPYAVAAGSTLSFDGSAADPDQDALTYLWTVDAGNLADGTVEDPVYTAPADTGTYEVAFTVTDPDGYTDTDTATVVVFDATAGGPYLAEVGASIPLEGSVTDPENHTFTYLWTAEAGSFANPAVEDPNYAAPGEAGIYDLAFTATHPGGALAVASTFVVVFDSTGGFLTGGGWIDSEPGWCHLDELCASAEGKANFGFVSKYQKGRSVPTGSTEFSFGSGGLNFHAGEYEWLVVNQGGGSAQLKGSGSVNGQASPTGELYKFMIWAADGADAGDTVRIKIWYEESGAEVPVYDNGADQPIGGGSIVIHTDR